MEEDEDSGIQKMDKESFFNIMKFPFKNKIIEEIFYHISKCIPPKTQVYLVGGTMRNASYYKHFKKFLPQRDYDLIVIGDHQKFIKNLRMSGFTYGTLRRKTQVVLKTPCVEKPDPDQFDDYVILDISFTDKGTIRKILEEKINFTINGFALNIKYLQKNWQERTICLPDADRDIRKKQIRLNKAKESYFSSDLFAALRFMSIGFSPPPLPEVDILYQAFLKFPKKKFQRNVEKLFRYVGGEAKARKLLKKIGITENIFSFKTILNHKNKKVSHSHKISGIGSVASGKPDLAVNKKYLRNLEK